MFLAHGNGGICVNLVRKLTVTGTHTLHYKAYHFSSAGTIVDFEYY